MGHSTHGRVWSIQGKENHVDGLQGSTGIGMGGSIGISIGGSIGIGTGSIGIGMCMFIGIGTGSIGIGMCMFICIGMGVGFRRSAATGEQRLRGDLMNYHDQSLLEARPFQSTVISVPLHSRS